MGAGGWDSEYGPFGEVVSWHRERGQLAEVHRVDARGNPPEVVLSVPLDRRAIEAEFALGPLVRWRHRSLGVWELVDTCSQAVLRGTGAADPPLGRGVEESARRVRVGWVLDWASRPGQPWSALPAAEELARIGARGDEPLPPEGLFACRYRFRTGDEHTAEEVVARFHDVLRPALEALAGGASAAVALRAVPRWLRDLAPTRDDAGWVAYFADLGPVDTLAKAHEVKFASISAEEWLRTLLPDERLWSWWSSRVVGAHEFEVVLVAPSGSVPTASFKWLAHAVGVESCQRLWAKAPGSPAPETS